MMRWYVLQSKPQKEPVVYEQLCIRKIEAYYPCIPAKVVNPRACKIKPYFPGYVFVHVDLDQLGPSALQWMPGTIGLVGYGGEPTFIPESLLQAIRRKVNRVNNIRNDLHNELRAGEIVAITSGPLAGYRAIFNSHLPGNERARVLLQLLQDRQICVKLSKKQLERIQ